MKEGYVTIPIERYEQMLTAELTLERVRDHLMTLGRKLDDINDNLEKHLKQYLKERGIDNEPES